MVASGIVIVSDLLPELSVVVAKLEQPYILLPGVLSTNCILTLDAELEYPLMDSVLLELGVTRLGLNTAAGVTTTVGVNVGVAVGVMVAVGVCVGVLVGVGVLVAVGDGVPGPTSIGVFVATGVTVGVIQTSRAAYTEPTAFAIDPDDTLPARAGTFSPLFNMLLLKSATLKLQTDFVSIERPETCGAAMEVPLLYPYF